MSNGPVEQLFELYRSPDADVLYDESVTELGHALQCAALAERDGADEQLVAAALLHDVGHLLLRDQQPIGEELTVDHRHDVVGGDYLEGLFGPGVAEPVRLHVAAKRYLCSVEPGYRDRLSAASVRSLRVQGGPMTADEVAGFEANPASERAIMVRRWDESGKVDGLAVPSFDNWVLLLESLAGDHRATTARSEQSLNVQPVSSPSPSAGSASSSNSEPTSNT